MSQSSVPGRRSDFDGEANRVPRIPMHSLHQTAALVKEIWSGGHIGKGGARKRFHDSERFREQRSTLVGKGSLSSRSGGYFDGKRALVPDAGAIGF